MIPFTLTALAKEYSQRRVLDHFDLLGFLPMLLSETNPAKAVEQLNAGYKHGGGWRAFLGFQLEAKSINEQPQLRYPGDPPMRAIAEARLRDERIILFESSWVAVVQPDGSFEVSRMD